MGDGCEPPLHRFGGTERTCTCGAVTVPDPTLRWRQGFGQGLGKRPRRGASTLGNLRVPRGPGKPPTR